MVGDGGEEGLGLAVQELQWRDKFVGDVQREVGQIGEERHS